VRESPFTVLIQSSATTSKVSPPPVPGPPDADVPELDGVPDDADDVDGAVPGSFFIVGSELEPHALTRATKARAAIRDIREAYEKAPHQRKAGRG